MKTVEYARTKPILQYTQFDWPKQPVNFISMQRNWKSFRNFNELKKVYSSASLVGDDRVMFNIMGNRSRLIVRIVFEYKAIQVKWFGTHTEYDNIDVGSIVFKRR